MHVLLDLVGLTVRCGLIWIQQDKIWIFKRTDWTSTPANFRGCLRAYSLSNLSLGVPRNVSFIVAKILTIVLELF